MPLRINSIENIPMAHSFGVGCRGILFVSKTRFSLFLVVLSYSGVRRRDCSLAQIMREPSQCCEDDLPLAEQSRYARIPCSSEFTGMPTPLQHAHLSDGDLQKREQYISRTRNPRAVRPWCGSSRKNIISESLLEM